VGVEQRITAPPAACLPPGTRVLIVEDQPFVALAVADMLLAMGADACIVAGSVDEAIASIDEDGIAVALLDIHLDGETSEPVASALRAAAIPFAVTSGFTETLPAVYGDAPRLLKPYLAGQLRASVTRLLA
jgi:DNA-binding response OmpR family regulator